MDAKRAVRIATLTSIFVLAYGSACLFLYAQAGSLRGDDVPCVTPGCLRIVSYLENSIDTSVDPCDDFYQFACGKALQSKQQNPRKIINSFYENMFQVYDEIENFLVDTKKYPNGASKNLVRLRNYYASCKNQSLLNGLGNKPIMSVIRRVGGFPILGEPSGWLPGSEKSFRWPERLAKYRSLGVKHDFLFSLYVDANPKDNSQTEIYLEEPMPDKVDVMIELGGPKMRAIEYALTLSRMVNLGASWMSASVYHMPQVYSLRSKLADIQSHLENDYTAIKMSEFGTLGLSVNLRQLIEDLMGRELHSDQVINVDFEYLLKLDKLLASTDTKVVANYMLYRLTRDLAPYLDESWNAGMGQQDCVMMLQDEMDLAIAHEYVKNFVSDEARNGVISLVDKIKTQTKVNIDQADWIKGSTVQVAKEKVDAIRSIVAFPDQFRNDSFMEPLLAQYNGLNPDDFLGNHLKIVKKYYDYNYNKFGHDQRDSYWELFAQTTITNAFYFPSFNSINIMAGIMLGRTFDKTSPMYLNFGSIGAIIGHEITHAFDPFGSQFDKNGNKLPKTWWNQDTLVGFERNKDCFIDKYDNLPVPGNEEVHISGTFTIGENMADNGGYQIAHEAYNLWVKQQGIEREPVLPGLKFNQDQLFWLALATTWCDVVDPNTSAYLAKTDVHSPPKYRVNIPFSNAKQFSEAFSCREGSYMNQTEKCVVW